MFSQQSWECVFLFHDYFHFYSPLPPRKTIIVNLDPANDVLPYECAIDLKSLITLDDVMSVHNLGPNGGKEENTY